MTAEQVFSIANRLAILGWIVLIFAGRRRWVASLITGVFLPLLLAVTYCILLATHWGEGSGGFGTLAGVAALFANPWILLAGWIHYLAFDMFIGSWEVRDAQHRGISHLLVIPCLILTFIFGPAGLLLYFAIRSVRAGTIYQPA
jgi:hypothetical protein